MAGGTYLFSAAIMLLAHYVLSPRLLVRGNPAATLANLQAHETLFRIEVGCTLLHALALVVLLAALYVILAPFGRGIALAAAGLRLVCALTWVGTAVSFLGLLRLPAGGADMARLYLGVGFDAYYAGLPFYGLASALCAWLWLRSREVPRVLAAWGLVASTWCALSGMAFLLFPGFGRAVNLYTLDTPMALFEMALSAWLLGKGIRRAAPR